MSFETRPSAITRRKKSPNRARLFLFFIVSIFIFFVAGYSSIKSVGNTPIKAGTYNINKGSSLLDIPDIFQLGVSDARYKLWIKFSRISLTLKAGTYTIKENINLTTLFEATLKNPTYSDLTITILPGWNIYDIDASLSDKKIIETGELLLAARDHFFDLQSKYPFLSGKKSLEGFLFPDTYRILESSDAYMILDRLLSEWQKKIYPTYQKLGENAYNELILASIVEREERVKSEQPIVAGILSKRVREGIAMGADATVCYEYAKTQKQCTPEFIGSVIFKKTPYNTRNKLGYPPTPISSISLSTWESVLGKKESEYYYYLHDSNGKIHYGRTLTEHNINKQTYLR